MKIKELVNKVNEKIKEYGYNTPEQEDSYENQAYRVGRLIKEVLEEAGIYTDTSIWPTHSDARLLFRDYNSREIYIKIKRKKGNTTHSFWRSYTNYYLDSIEIEGIEEESLQDLFTEWTQKEIEKKNNDNKNIKQFNDTLKEKGLSLDEFKNLMNLYNKYRYQLDSDWWKFC